MDQFSFRRIIRAIVFTSACAAIAMPAIAQTPPDNTKVNTRDRAKGAVTADQQKENATDRDVARKIRQSLVKDKGLSTYAHNVKVIAQGGQVTLKGPVRSDEEMKAVEAKATEVAGAGHVTNQMSVVPAPAKRSKD
jgi:osmotically-inducible protein OsmY